MENPYFIGIISWFIPGVGHLIQGRLTRGIIIGAVIWTMFIIAIVSGGAYYPGFGFKDGSLALFVKYICTIRKWFGRDNKFLSFGKSAAKCCCLGDF